jgi:hypothetical protein
MVRSRVTLLILLSCISVGSAEEGSDPATILEEQTKRRRQEELTRVGREQKLKHLQFEQKLGRFDRRLTAKRRRIGDRALRRYERQRLGHELDQIQRKETRRQSRLEQSLTRLELGERNGGLRQKQELDRLRHRQRSEAFIGRQKIKLRRNRLPQR